MLRESGSGQDTSEVGGWILLKKRLLLTAGHSSSLVIDRLCDEAGKEGLAVAWSYICSCLTKALKIERTKVRSRKALSGQKCGDEGSMLAHSHSS